MERFHTPHQGVGFSSNSKHVFVLNHEYTISGANNIDLTTLEERQKSLQHSVVLIGS